MIPIRLFWTPGITQIEIDATVIAIANMHDELFGRAAEMDVFGDWVNPNGHVDGAGELLPHLSLEWYLENTWDQERQQLYAGPVIQRLATEHEKFGRDSHIDVVLTEHDLYDDGTNFIFGEAANRSAIFSTARFQRQEAIVFQYLVAHELGHIFGLPREDRNDVVQSLGPHCTQHGCIMRQSLSMEEAVFHANETRSIGRMFCPNCVEDARVAVI